MGHMRFRGLGSCPRRGRARAKTRFADAVAVRAVPQGLQARATPLLAGVREAPHCPRMGYQFTFSLLSTTLTSLKECGLTGLPSVCSCTHFRVYQAVP
jgi:hypothetical protein